MKRDIDIRPIYRDFVANAAKCEWYQLQYDTQAISASIQPYLRHVHDIGTFTKHMSGAFPDGRETFDALCDELRLIGLQRVKLQDATKQNYVSREDDDDDDWDDDEEEEGRVRCYFIGKNMLAYIDSYCNAEDAWTASLHLSYYYDLAHEAEGFEQFDVTLKSLSKFIVVPKPVPCLNLIVSQGNGYSYQPFSKNLQELEEGNYNEDVVEAFGKIKERILEKEEGGRLFIVDGPPGGGKTHFAKAISQAVGTEAKCFFIPTGVIPHLSNPNFASFMIGLARQGDTVVFIIEDADFCLMKRGRDNMDAVEAILNFTSGILGDAIDCFFLCTTNAEFLSLDEAVTRPGRLDRRVHIGHLDVERAQGVLDRLNVDHKTKKPMLLADIYAMARKDDEIDLPDNKKAKVGF